MATCLFGETDIRASVAAMEAALDRVKMLARFATDMPGKSEHERMMACVQLGEAAAEAASAATRLGLNARYLGGFLSGAGVPDRPVAPTTRKVVRPVLTSDGLPEGWSLEPYPSAVDDVVAAIRHRNGDLLRIEQPYDSNEQVKDFELWEYRHDEASPDMPTHFDDVGQAVAAMYQAARDYPDGLKDE